MASSGNTERPFTSLLLLGIVDFCCILIGLEQISVHRIASGTVWMVVGVGSGLIGYHWSQVKRAIASVGTWFKKKPSKLEIHWANYRAVENGGDVYEVGDFLRQIISGDSLVFDIENHNFVTGDKNFVPRDPLWGKEKRLQVNYSYGGQPARTTERREHGRLLLPEDSKIKYLMDEVDRLKAAQPRWSQYPVPQLRNKIVAMVSELQGFLGEHGDEPVTRLTGESTKDTALRYFKEGDPWRAKFIGDYRLTFGDSIPKLRDEMRARAHIDDLDLNNDIEWASSSPDRCCESVNNIAKKLWELGFRVNV